MVSDNDTLSQEQRSGLRHRRFLTTGFAPCHFWTHPPSPHYPLTALLPHRLNTRLPQTVLPHRRPLHYSQHTQFSSPDCPKVSRMCRSALSYPIYLYLPSPAHQKIYRNYTPVLWLARFLPVPACPPSPEASYSPYWPASLSDGFFLYFHCFPDSCTEPHWQSLRLLPEQWRSKTEFVSRHFHLLFPDPDNQQEYYFHWCLSGWISHYAEPLYKFLARSASRFPQTADRGNAACSHTAVHFRFDPSRQWFPLHHDTASPGCFSDMP